MMTPSLPSDPHHTLASDRESSPEDEGPPDSDDHDPYVCPGCYAIGTGCAPGCIDAEIDLDRADRLDTHHDEASSSDRDSGEPDDDWPF